MDSDSSASDALLIGAVTVTLALAVGFGLFKLFLPKEAATSPISVGRKWFAWMIFISTLICLPKFFHKLDADAFVTWLICCVFFGGLAFLLGYLYGLFRFRKKSSSVDAPMATSSSPVSPPPEISTKLMNDQDTSCDDEPFYAQAMMEIQNGNTSPGLWAKAFSKMQGDDAKSKALYIAIRATQLKEQAKISQTQSRSDEVARQVQEKARQKALDSEDRATVESKRRQTENSTCQTGTLKAEQPDGDCVPNQLDQSEQKGSLQKDIHSSLEQDQSNPTPEKYLNDREWLALQLILLAGLITFMATIKFIFFK